MEPTIVYKAPAKFRIQKTQECVANALCALLEIMHRLKGRTVILDAAQLDDEIRAHLGWPESRGVPVLPALVFLRNKKGLLRSEHFVLKDLRYAHRKLREDGVLAVVIKRYGKKWYDKDGYLRVDEAQPKKNTHLVVFLGWDTAKKAFLVLDSNHEFLYYMDEERFDKDVKTIYSITV